jgi:2-succinyl-5-enolpyruvyl-6-hydroxy-3-cyclohexene-1-carboxylate synthase
LIIPSIINLVSICAQKGIHHAILSPGSRCAPITLAFVRHPKIQCKTISDERAAAFIGLGMAQQLEQPVVLVCTSGSAAYNYAPAVAEAYFQQIPLIVITADRPKEWIDQWDGQTIRQREIYGQHVKGSFEFPDDCSHPDKIWHAQRITNEAINLANQYPPGPVHINIPIREPFYPDTHEIFDFQDVKIIEQIFPDFIISNTQKSLLKERLKSYQKILIVPGQQKPDEEIQQLIDLLAQEDRAVVVTDTISNLQSAHTITFHDHFIGHTTAQESLTPDLILSFGKSIISKSLKLFLRNSNAEHWHIQKGGYSPDTYQSLQTIIHAEPNQILELLYENLPQNPAFSKLWRNTDQSIRNQFHQLVEKSAFGELKAVSKILTHLPEKSKLHVANSMAVRYLNFFGNRPQEIICNRGTSGIDGSNSTAVGCTFTTKEFVTLITGDMAFFYDRNAFWHNYPMHNLRIVLLNNHAGGIFRFIEGPSQQPELEEYFETLQSLTAKNLANEFGFEYEYVTEESDLDQAMVSFYKSSISPKIIEIKSESADNVAILKNIRAQLKF